MSLSQTLKRTVHQRAGGCCEYCKLSVEHVAVPFHVDHIIPCKHDDSDDAESMPRMFRLQYVQKSRSYRV